MTGERGRLKIAFQLESYYSGVDAPIPDDNEGFTNSFGDFCVFRKQTDGSFKKLNSTGDLRAKIDNLDQAGVFDNAEAFIMNRKIYRMYFSSLRSTIRIDPELRFDAQYRYYAVREVESDVNGAYKYITGVKELNPDGSVKTISNLVDMNIEDSDSGDGTKVSVPQVGGTLNAVTDGQNYMVEFFDNTRMLINRISFQAVAAAATDLDLSPDMAISDILVTTNRAVTGIDNACFLYRGESKDNLEIRVFLKYTDGRTRDVTHERIEGGRLTITGMPTISTDTVTPTGTIPTQKFTVTYQMIKSNSTSDASTTPSGSIIDPSALTIAKQISVYIKEDIYADIDKVLTAGFVTEPIPGTHKINIKYFGHYTSGAVHDITNIVEYVSSPPVTGDAGIGVTQNIIIRVPFGNAGLYKQFSFSLLATNGKKYCLINGADARFLYADTTQTANNQYSGLFSGFKVYSEGNQTMNSVSADSLCTLMQYSISGAPVTPNYIRIRDVENSSYLYTGYIKSDSSLLYYNDDLLAAAKLYADRPVLVEFLYITLENGVAIDTFVTGALIHYIRF